MTMMTSSRVGSGLGGADRCSGRKVEAGGARQGAQRKAPPRAWSAEESDMIIRVWRAKVHKGMEVDFWSLIQAQAVPLLHRQPGLIALHVGSILWGGGEFVIVSTWQDLDALQTFAGDRWR